MTRPCTDCKHCVYKHGIAGNYYCDKKKALASIARITDKDGHHVDEDCFEGKEVDKDE